MNETKRNNVDKVYESLTREEAIVLCKNLIAENEELKNDIEALSTDYRKSVKYAERLACALDCAFDIILEST